MKPRSKHRTAHALPKAQPGREAFTLIEAVNLVADQHGRAKYQDSPENDNMASVSPHG
jgi:hypothetical protein